MMLAGLLASPLAFRLAWGANSEAPGPTDLNLVVITLDTTRADRLPPYGFSGVRAPNIERLAREGVVFDDVSAAAPLTLPAHCSLFTGRYPFRHGVRDNGQALDPREVTLASVLHDRGVRTGAFIGAYVLDGHWGLNHGFDRYVDDFELAKRRDPSASGLQHPANEVADSALEWLATASASPFFAWIHFYDPHAPYRPPEPYRSVYRDEPYLGEIAFVDSQIGRVLEFLESRHLLDRTIFVLIGDHGESLGEHGESTHGLFVYQSVVQVPFIILAPFHNLRGRRVQEPVRSVDLMPTVLDLFGIPSPESMDGVTLLPAMSGTARDADREVYAESEYPNRFGWSDLRALRSGRFKLIAAPKPELYDLATDPREERNLYADRRALADHMRRRLQELELEPRVRPISPGAHDAGLAALGYVSGSENPQPPDAGGIELPDPKDKLDLYRRITEQHEAVQVALGANAPFHAFTRPWTHRGERP